MLVYILYSKKIDRYYVGSTTKSIEERLQKHNTCGYGSKSYTSHTDDWVVFLEIGCDTYAQAMKIEKHIKRMKSRKYIMNLKLYSDIIKRILEKYK